MIAIINKFFSISALFFVIVSAQAQSVFILIHGTWGADSSWYMPQGDFFDVLENVVSAKNSSVVSFRWSGGCGHVARVKAAESLVKLIQSYDSSTIIYIIGHSHGGNVATLASQLLAQDEENKHVIHVLFTLGTPVMSNYFPNMKTIHYLYNFFSLEDLIQTVLGISLREFPKHRRIANMRVFVDGKEPIHADLHHPHIAKWIAYIHNHFRRYLLTHGIKNRISEPSIAYFSYDRPPRYALDYNRAELLERDRQLSVLILDSLRKSFETESNIPLTNL